MEQSLSFAVKQHRFAQIYERLYSLRHKVLICHQTLSACSLLCHLLLFCVEPCAWCPKMEYCRSQVGFVLTLSQEVKIFYYKMKNTHLSTKYKADNKSMIKSMIIHRYYLLGE